MSQQKNYHVSSHIRGKLIQHNLKNQHMPSKLHAQSGELLSQSDTSMDSRDLKKKLIFLETDNFESSEFIGIERGCEPKK